jgi:hypothetical protein
LAPAATVCGTGSAPIDGEVCPGRTVRIADVVVTDPTLFVMTHSYRVPDWAVETPLKLRVAVPEPATPFPSESGAKLVPPFVETSHWKAGAGFPLVVTAKLAFPPEPTVSSPGWDSMEGAVRGGRTVRTAGVVAAELTLFVATHSYS